MFAALACESTALSLEDPNALNAVFEPSFIGADSYQLPLLLVIDVDIDESEASADDDAAIESVAAGADQQAVLDYDFGDGLLLVSWQFTADFEIDIVVQRFFDAQPGVRNMTVRIHNRFGTFLARGEFNVL